MKLFCRHNYKIAVSYVYVLFERFANPDLEFPLGEIPPVPLEDITSQEVRSKIHFVCTKGCGKTKSIDLSGDWSETVGEPDA